MEGMFHPIIVKTFNCRLTHTFCCKTKNEDFKAGEGYNSKFIKFMIKQLYYQTKNANGTRRNPQLWLLIAKINCLKYIDLQFY